MSVIPPESLKPVAGYVKLANDTETRDPIIAYWIRVYVMQKALKIDSKSPEARSFLVNIMDRLEKDKVSLKDNEALTTDLVAQAHVENYGQKIFDVADQEDRAGTASLKTVRAFLASAQIFEILSVFGEVTEEVAEKQKYAKYRASVIMKALKAGEKPPLPENLDGQLQSSVLEPPGGSPHPSPASGGQDDFNDPFGSFNSQPPPPPSDEPSTSSFSGYNSKPSRPPAQSSQSLIEPSPSHECSSSSSSAVAMNGVPLTPKKSEKVNKYIKYANSALVYDDVPTAVNNLEKALYILKTGQES